MTNAAHPRVDEIKSNLNMQRNALRNTIRQLLHQSDDPKIMTFANHLSEVEDWVEADVLNDIDIAQCNLELSELRAVDAALARIKAGTYGICIDCGDNISVERLDATPVAERCIDCQEHFEKMHVIAPGTPAHH